MCSNTPRFSLDPLKTVICACPRWSRGPVYPSCWPVTPTYGTGYTGWLYRVGIPGGYTGGVPSHLLAGSKPRQRSGPRKAQGGWSGWSGCSGRATGYGGTGRSVPPSGPGRSHPWALPVPPSQMSHLGPKGRDSSQYSVKLVRTTKCRQEMCKRPVIVPVCQNGSEKSPLEILRFPFSVAFSCKELMGPF